MATPFSPFCGKIRKPPIKRRQSQIPSDLIDWDAPEIPELEKQKIIYEDHIQELNEDHEIETLLKEQTYQVVLETLGQEFQTKLKELQETIENERNKSKELDQGITKEKSTVNLLLGQIKMFEANAKENLERIDELEKEVDSLHSTIAGLNEDKENLCQEKNTLLSEIENLNFRNNEMACELSQNLEVFRQKKSEMDELKLNYNNVREKLRYYMKLAKNKVNDD